MGLIQIRRATATDAPALAGLRWEFRAGRAPAVEDRAAFVARCTAWMARELGPDGDWRGWVAEDAGRIVGQVWLNVIPKVPNPVGERDRHAYLSNLFVVPAARGGVGTQLLEAALAYASADGVDAVVLWPSARSRTLYVRYGFTSNGDVLERRSE